MINTKQSRLSLITHFPQQWVIMLILIKILRLPFNPGGMIVSMDCYQHQCKIIEEQVTFQRTFSFNFFSFLFFSFLFFSFLFFFFKKKKKKKKKKKNWFLFFSSWRRPRVDQSKVVYAVLAMCLNVGVKPPDALSMKECAELESWLLPESISKWVNDTWKCKYCLKTKRKIGKKNKIKSFF